MFEFKVLFTNDGEAGRRRLPESIVVGRHIRYRSDEAAPSPHGRLNGSGVASATVAADSPRNSLRLDGQVGLSKFQDEPRFWVGGNGNAEAPRDVVRESAENAGR
ncbi:hypothetical protein MTX26_27460 [Bradyrhizobium sp. ISRA443]|uniref:hypothetical protein n=1 Tax=unclassified Bradyrhizobium TaxID=2631580 RepID=UPI002479E4AC|nr:MULTISPECIES: hypothetical protein [unclassified Bradyrhizobium]WGR98009.1 hypothetical protein MTX23_27450 [Bradyrhizobium sp. ISRA436]WGS11782.1 hypothetical protein MTX26_27460 [Bradyrhizobium sp. ISRA443]